MLPIFCWLFHAHFWSSWVGQDEMQTDVGINTAQIEVWAEMPSFFFWWIPRFPRWAKKLFENPSNNITRGSLNVVFVAMIVGAAWMHLMGPGRWPGEKSSLLGVQLGDAAGGFQPTISKYHVEMGYPTIRKYHVEMGYPTIRRYHLDDIYIYRPHLRVVKPHETKIPQPRFRQDHQAQVRPTNPGSSGAGSGWRWLLGVGGIPAVCDRPPRCWGLQLLIFHSWALRNVRKWWVSAHFVWYWKAKLNKR